MTKKKGTSGFSILMSSALGTQEAFERWNKLKQFTDECGDGFSINVHRPSLENEERLIWIYRETGAEGISFDLPDPFVVYDVHPKDDTLNFSSGDFRVALIRYNEGSIRDAYNAIVDRHAQKGDAYSQLPVIRALHGAILDERERYQNALDKLYAEARSVLNALVYVIMNCVNEAYEPVWPEDKYWESRKRRYVSRRSDLKGEWRRANKAQPGDDTWDRRFRQRAWVLSALSKEYSSSEMLSLEGLFLWEEILSAGRAEGLRNDLRAVCEFFEVPDFVVHAIWDGIRYYRQKIEYFLEAIIKLEAKRAACEMVINSVLLDVPLQVWEQVAASLRGAPYEDESPQFSKFRADAKWLPYGRFIVNRNEELVAQSVSSREERAKKIGVLLNEKHEVDTSDFRGTQLGRVMKAHYDGRFNDD